MFSNKVYDILKWVSCVGCYALWYLWSELSKVWGFPYADEIGKTIIIIGGTIGILIGISSVKYAMKKDTTDTEEESEDAESLQ